MCCAFIRRQAFSPSLVATDGVFGRFYWPARLRDDHLCAGLMELLPQLPLMKDHLNVLDVLKERRDAKPASSALAVRNKVKQNHLLLKFILTQKTSVCKRWGGVGVPGRAHWSWECWELWTGPVVTGLKGDPPRCRPGPGSYIHPSQLKPSPAASLPDRKNTQLSGLSGRNVSDTHADTIHTLPRK